MPTSDVCGCLQACCCPQVMSKAQLPLLTSIMMVVQAFLSAPAGLRAKRSIADRNQVRPCSAWVACMNCQHAGGCSVGMGLRFKARQS